jgi:hypothetical protein
VSKRAYEENNNISTFDLKLLFTIRDKKRTSELVGDLQSKFIKLYGCENKKIKILLNEVYVKLEEEK